MNTKNLLLIGGSGLMLFNSCQTNKQQEKTNNKLPNILVIVADDAGYSDFGAFGSEISTPHIDSLAEEGIRFSRFHTSTLSAPTRSMLLTGVDTHQNGLGAMPALHSSNQYKKAGYEGYLNDQVITLPEVLRENGYETFMAGKWHLGFKEGTRPSEKGFDHSFALLNGGASHFSNAFRLGPVEPKVQYVDDGKVVEKLPDDFYSSQFYADKIIQYIENTEKDKPFFAYLAFTAPHDPLQVPDSLLNKYKGKYDVGYKAIRDKRFEKQKEIGLFPKNLSLVEKDEHCQNWDKMSDEARKYEAKKMEIYATMIENMDFNIGRVLNKLKAMGKLDNTIVIFMSDNGANSHDMTKYGIKMTGKYSAELDGLKIDNSYENIGKPNSFVSEGEAWAHVSDTPLAYFKSTSGEGGVNTPLIIAGPMVKSDNKVDTKDLVYVADIMPTLLDITGIQKPDSLNGIKLHPFYGKSFKTILNGTAKFTARANEALCIEMIENKIVLKGNWKARALQAPYGDGSWMLFDLKNDPMETKDLSKANPDKLKELIGDWDIYSQKVGYIKRNSRTALDSIGSVKKFYENL